jgi:nucleoside-diphosphate-sugar epimerase
VWRLVGLVAVVFLAGRLALAAKPSASREPYGADTAQVVLTPGEPPTTAFVAYPGGTQAASGIIIVHEWWGSNEQIRGIARRLARQGYVAIVPDLYHGKVTDDPEEAHELSRGLEDAPALADLQAARAWLRAQPRTAKSRIGVVGFCIGGRLSELLALDNADLSAAVMFTVRRRPTPAAGRAARRSGALRRRRSGHHRRARRGAARGAGVGGQDGGDLRLPRRGPRVHARRPLVVSSGRGATGVVAHARVPAEEPEGLIRGAMAARVLLLGGTGFLGSHAARALVASGHDITTLARCERHAIPGAESLRADRGDADSLAEALAGRRYDVAVDFSAWTAGDVERLMSVTDAALGRYVLISTGQVCLVTAGGPMPFREEDSEHPLIPEPGLGTPDHREWSYGVGKRRAEAVLQGLRLTHGVRGLILRLPVVLGAGDSSLRTWAYLERMLDGGPLLVPDGGRQIVRFLWVQDVARAVVDIVESPPPSPIYHLAQPVAAPLAHVLEHMAAAAGVAPRFVDVGDEDLAAAGLDRSCSPYSGSWVSVLDPSRAAAEWGFVATRLEDSLPQVVRAHIEDRPPRSHAGYARRDRERTLASRLQEVVKYRGRAAEHR